MVCDISSTSLARTLLFLLVASVMACARASPTACANLDSCSGALVCHVGRCVPENEVVASPPVVEIPRAPGPPPAHVAPLPEATVDPSQPKRGGWWQKAKKSFGGG